MSNDRPTPEQALRRAVARAHRAPSVHNTQPWLWELRDGSLELFADPERMVNVADPSGRQMVISCGAALHHAKVALTGMGYEAAIVRMPDPSDAFHVATITIKPVTFPDERDRVLGEAVQIRRSDRRPLGPLADNEVHILKTAFHDDLVSITVLDSDGAHLVKEASELAVRERAADEPYHRELNWWSGHYRLFDGVPRSSLPSLEKRGAVPSGREFPAGTLKPQRDMPDRASLLIMSTSGDSAEDWLRCGEAMSAVLLRAAASRLGACPVTHVTEIEDSRALVRDAAQRAGEVRRYPQVVIRAGERLATGLPPETGRRPVEEILRIRVSPDN
ncbi:Acg family FMN-binding oxidoreductase [Hoyosella subflava]|uniref:Nitroreductase domain-containing protein n=1 Tax=Hoyosella subflava (strain DSM 45089 / JCM 17490 / NBRC 109087 / DQS3-9A1) TaxID=443218 RepID=F6EGQ7_HOYSD|nr:hypothetical protein [Hoyosella subflava]AEF42295.1 hypothetical protein AS9A_3857 [Hoyosella subflava DQS3-9A1]